MPNEETVGNFPLFPLVCGNTPLRFVEKPGN